MNPTVARAGCGTFLALLLHRELGEQPCSECLRGEDVHRLAREGIPRRPQPPLVYQPVTAAEAAFNRGVIEREIREHGRAKRAARTAR